jgi:D-3-phosphoglycerate dehydrogenase
MDILVTEDIKAEVLDRLAEQYRVVRDGTLWKDGSRLRDQIREARTIIIRNQTRLTAELLAAAPKLLAIGRHGVGLDNIDLDAASQAGVVVLAPLDANALSVAELTMGLILALARMIPAADRSTKNGHWERIRFTGIELAGQTLAICGFGRIGRKVAGLARAFGMHIVVFDPFVKTDSAALREAGAAPCSQLEEALAQAEFVTAHSPLTAETWHTFNIRTFAAMKHGAFFINTSRGGVVDEAALLEALQRGHLAGAALDVREVEPPTARGAFEALDNVILTPHIASFTREAQTRTAEAVAADIDRILRGEPAINFVNFSQPRIDLRNQANG